MRAQLLFLILSLYITITLNYEPPVEITYRSTQTKESGKFSVKFGEDFVPDIKEEIKPVEDNPDLINVKLYVFKQSFKNELYDELNEERNEGELDAVWETRRARMIRKHYGWKFLEDGWTGVGNVFRPSNAQRYIIVLYHTKSRRKTLELESVPEPTAGKHRLAPFYMVYIFTYCN